MRSILSFQMLCDAQQTNFLLNGIEPLVSLQCSSATLKIGGFVSRNSLNILCWFGSAPWCCGWPRAVFCAVRRRASSIVLWLPKNWAKNSWADGGGGGGKSSPLPSWLLPAPARVHVICEVATISNYWLMSRDCRWIIIMPNWNYWRNSQIHNKNRGITIHSHNMTSPIWPLIVLITHANLKRDYQQRTGIALTFIQTCDWHYMIVWLLMPISNYRSIT